MTQSNECFNALARRFSVPTPEAAIQIAARKLLEKCNISAPPVPLEPIEGFLNVRAKVRRNVPAPMLSASHDGFVIVEPSDQTGNPLRKRFSRAHELAHILLLYLCRENGLPTSHGTDSEHYRQIERYCDLAAGEMLVPKEFLRTALLSNAFARDGMDALQEAFRVSKTALVTRLQAALASSSVTVWRKYQRHEREALTHRVSANLWSKSFRQAPAWLPVGCTTRHMSEDIVGRALDARKPILIPHLVVTLGSRVSNCTALAMPFYRNDTAQPSLFEESQSIRLTDDAVLVVYGNLSASLDKTIWQQWTSNLDR